MAKIGWKTQESVPVAVAIERLALSMPKSEKDASPPKVEIELPSFLSPLFSPRDFWGGPKLKGESETCKRFDDVKSDEITA